MNELVQYFLQFNLLVFVGILIIFNLRLLEAKVPLRVWCGLGWFVCLFVFCCWLWFCFFLFSWHSPYRNSNRSKNGFLSKQFSCSNRLIFRYAVPSFKQKKEKGAAAVPDQSKSDTEDMGDRLRKESLIWAQLFLKIKPKWDCLCHWELWILLSSEGITGAY